MSRLHRRFSREGDAVAGSTGGKHQIEVWMDGRCRLCRRSQAWCEQRDRDQRLVFRDFRIADDAELPLHRDAHEGSLWVRADDGRLQRGFAGWLLIMNELPRWRWLARVAAMPPFRWFGPPVYLLVARFRHLVP
jgi:predicted DCC family thiol-disulfide oxidoreductase YuxK